MASALTKRDHCDIAIAGGGLAGSLAAIHLARVGFNVVVFEKSENAREPVCGEFLSADCFPLLKEVGFDPFALGGHEITGFRLHGPSQSASLRLPRRAVGLRRTVLDEEMRRLAAEAGADVRRGVRVTDLLEYDDFGGSILISTTAGETRASRLIVATGQDEFPSLNDRVGRDTSLVGFKMQIRLKPSCANRLGTSCDLFAFEGGYGALTPLGNGFADLCFVIDKQTLQRLPTDWDSLTSWIGRSNWAVSHLLDGAEPQSKTFASVGDLPIGFLRRERSPAGVFFVGDQMAVLPPVAGDGLAIALMTARRAVDEMLEEGGRLRFAPEAARSYQLAVRRALRPQMEASLAIHAVLKTSRFVDMSVYTLRLFPALFERAYWSTRCHLVETSDRERQRRRSFATLNLKNLAGH